MKAMSSLYAIFGWLALSLSGYAATYDLTGRWVYTATDFDNTCGDTNPISESLTVEIIQSENVFYIVYPYKTLKGTINGSKYTTEADEYSDEGGTTTETITFTASSSSYATGDSNWTWEVEGYACSGDYSMEWNRESQNSPIYDASGTWDVVLSNFDNSCGLTGIDEPKTFNISQHGNIVNGQDDRGYSLKGFINGKDYTVSQSISENYGTSSVVCDVNLTTATQGGGTCKWVWDDDIDSSYICTGSWNVSITKKAIKLKSMPGIPLLLLSPDKPTDLFFSEYIEGSSVNKALEIYNGTGAAIDLSDGNYEILIYFNGSSTAGTTIPLTGAIADGDVYVVADDGASAAILAEADQTPTHSLFNGNDAVALIKNGATLDVIGQIGFNPGTEWGTGDLSTANRTLRRKSTVVKGDKDGTDAFDPSLEWDGFPQDTFDGLGEHTAN